MRIETTGQRLVRTAMDLALAASSALNRARISRRDREDARNERRARAAGPTVDERRADLVAFYDTYENFVEVLCDAAQYGPTPRLESRYAEFRRPYVEAYSPLRRFLVSYLRFKEEEDGEVGMQPSDPFEALAEPESLYEFLQSDDGSVISRINRTREALNLYAEHLRQLTARNA